MQLKILGARRVTCSKFYTENPQIFGATVRNLSAATTRRPWSLHPWHVWQLTMYYVLRRSSIGHVWLVKRKSQKAFLVRPSAIVSLWHFVRVSDVVYLERKSSVGRSVGLVQPACKMALPNGNRISWDRESVAYRLSCVAVSSLTQQPCGLHTRHSFVFL